MVGRPRLEESKPAKRIVYNADVGKTICINREINNRQEKLMDNFFKVKKQNCFALKVFNNIFKTKFVFPSK